MAFFFYLANINFFVMKINHLLALLLLITVVSCKKDPEKTPEEIYAERLNGNWVVSTLNYSATITVPIIGTIPVNGTANNAGTISFNTPARTAVYDIRFLPNISIPGVPIDSVEFFGTGTFTNTTSQITVTDSAGTLTFNVVKNEPNFQQVTTIVNYSLGGQSIPVNLNLSLSR